MNLIINGTSLEVQNGFVLVSSTKMHTFVYKVVLRLNFYIVYIYSLYITS